MTDAAALASPALTDAIGIVAGCLTTAAFVPQLVKVWRSRSAEDLSLGMFLMLTLGVALWLAYGLLTWALPVILANGVTLILALAILALKLRFG
ncbi:MAG TPA: SemiSWEET transporter [Azospirillaceae bacterium]|nr:SemiSWEET transporter [Azospirillaceae bacterium]